MLIKTTKKAFNLVEITIAVSFIALAFLPIMGMFTSNIRITERDKMNIVAMNLCQEKLDEALNLKFSAFNKFANNGKNNQGETIFNTIISDTEGKSVDLRDSTIGNVIYHFELNVSDRPSYYNVCYRIIGGSDTGDADAPSDDGKYDFKAKQKKEYKGLIHRYKMRVWWEERGTKPKAKPGNLIRDYSLITFKANLKSE